jgi:hypothetical protein
MMGPLKKQFPNDTTSEKLIKNVEDFMDVLNYQSKGVFLLNIFVLVSLNNIALAF